MTKLTERQVRLIKEDKASKYRELADKYEVSVYTIGSIKSGRSWIHILPGEQVKNNIYGK